MALRLVLSTALLFAGQAIAAPRIPSYVKPVCSRDNGVGFGYRVDAFTGRVAFHSGLDFSVEIGHPVLAAADGRVIMAERRGPYGLAVEIDHGAANRTRYGHLSALAVSAGEPVFQGQTLGWSGATGRASTPQLHFEVWRNDRVRDPRKYLHSNPRCAH